MKGERILQLQIRLSLDQGRILQRIGEEDSHFFDRVMRETNITDLLNGVYGKYRSSVSVFGGEGVMAWKAKAKSTASDEVDGE